MPLTPSQESTIAAVERLLSELFGTPVAMDKGGKYPHRRLSWRDRGWADLYPQLDSMALVTAAIPEDRLAALHIQGVSPARNKPNLTRIRIDPGFDRKALGEHLKAAWGPPR